MARSERGGRNTQNEKRTSIRDKARQAAEQRERSQGGLDTLVDVQDAEFFKPKMGKGAKGENFFSIVPYVVSIENHPFQLTGDLWHECTYWVHKVGAGDDSKRFVCPAKTAQAVDKRCPICEYRAALIKSGEDPTLAEELKPKQRQLFNILDHDDEDKGIQIYEVSPHMFGFMLDDEDITQADKKFDGRFYGDFQDGLAIVARFNQGSFSGRKFAEIARIDFEFRDDLEEQLVFNEAIDFDAHLRILPYDELSNKFFETGSTDLNKDQNEGKGTNSREERGKGSESRRESSGRQTERSTNERTSRDQSEKESRGSDNKSRTSSRGRTERTSERDNNEGKEQSSGQRSRHREPPKEPEKSPDNPCPHGFVFGKDNNNDDLCDKCENDTWNDCKDEKERLEAQENRRGGTSGKK